MNEKSRAAPHHAADLHFPVVRFDELLDHRQANTGATGCPRARAIHAIETLEDIGQVLRGDTGTRIRDKNRQLVSVYTRGNGHLPAIGCPL